MRPYWIRSSGACGIARVPRPWPFVTSLCNSGMCESDDLLHVWPCRHAHITPTPTPIPKPAVYGGSQWARRRLPALLLPLLLLLQDR